jgi:hypothetical protein
MDLTEFTPQQLRTKLSYYNRVANAPFVSKAYKTNATALIADLKSELAKRGKPT